MNAGEAPITHLVMDEKIHGLESDSVYTGLSTASQDYGYMGFVNSSNLHPLYFTPDKYVKLTSLSM